MSRHTALTSILRSPSGVAAMLLSAAILLLALLAPWLLDRPAHAMAVLRSGEGPSADFLFGTDMLGRSILARALAATRLSLALTLAATLLAALLGVGFGVGVALAPPLLRRLGLRGIDVMLSFPGILLAIATTAVIGTSAQGVVVAIGLAYAPDFARLGSTLAAAVNARDFIAAARVLRVPAGRLFRRHILPNIGESLVISTFATSASTLVAISSLSFLGLGVQPPDYDWGRMLVEGVDAFYITPLAVLAPAILIALTGLTLGFDGEVLARAMNPLLWTHEHRTRAVAAVPAVAETLQTAPSAQTVLSIQDLVVSYPGPLGHVPVVRGVSLSIASGEIVGVVGESGSGKSQTALALADLIQPPGRVQASLWHFAGRDIAGLDVRARRAWFGAKLAVVFQDPMSSLNPTLTVGTQVAEPLVVHNGATRRSARARALLGLGRVGLANPAANMGHFPHQLSGGMQQRVMIAMGLVKGPALLIADEPTTALDVTIQAQVVDVLRDVNQTHGTAILLISHNVGVIAAIASRVLVMYAGLIVEDAPIERLLAAPAHPYSKGLIASVPTLTMPLDQDLGGIAGRAPNPDEVGAGCAFAPRCSVVLDRCRSQTPPLLVAAPRHRAACWRIAADMSSA